MQIIPIITVLNNTGYTCNFLFLSPTISDDWEENVLGDEFLLYGESIKIKLAHPLDLHEYYDFKMIDIEGDEYIKWEVILTEDAIITFTISDMVN